MNENEKLLDRLGGPETLMKIVELTYVRVLADPDLKGFFEGVPMDRLRKMQFQFLAAAFDGPIEYSGAEITAVHSGRGITANHFSKFCGHFVDTLNELNVDSRDIDNALGRLAIFKDKVTGETNVDG